MEWTPSAEQELARLLLQARGVLGDEGADPDEVGDDIRRHVETEMEAADATVVTAEDVRRLLQAMGVPVLGSPGDAAGSSRTPPAHPRSRPVRMRTLEPAAPTVRLVLFGVLLPLAAIWVEISTRICATSFFDPLPTIGHVLLYGSIIVASVVLLYACHRTGLRHPRPVGWITGFAIGASLLFSLRFLPLLPISVFALLIGFGFLSLSPFFALWALGTGRRWLSRRADAQDAALGSVWWGIGAAVLFALVIEVSPALTRLGLQMAVAPEPTTRARGLSLLRGVGSEDQLLRACYQRSSRGGGLLGWAFAFSHAPTTTQARQIYYRITGRPFNAVPPPRMPTRSAFDFGGDELVWSEQGGDAVGGRVRGLRLASSRLDGSIDGEAALAYTEWTLEFENLSEFAQEARAQIALPAGGVVSRLTLWVDGDEREAVFGPRGTVTEAYQEIAIRRRRDPVLVRTSGPDRVLVQCFPVLPGGVRMKVRLGITAPLELDRPDRGFLGTPSFVERNFEVPAGRFHAVWWESHMPITSTSEGLRAEHPEDDVYAVRGRLGDADLVAGRGGLKVERPGRSDRAWTPDPEEPRERAILQRIVGTEGPRHPAPRSLAIVVDGSRLMQSALGSVAEAIQGLPDGIDLHVLVAREDVPDVLVEGRTTSAGVLREAAGLLGAVTTRGGSDAAPALARACDAVADAPGGLVLWVFGPQPVELGSVNGITQRFDRRPDGAGILALQAVPGPNRVLEALDGYARADTLSRRGEVATDLTRLFQAWRDAAPGIRFEREREPRTEALEVSAKRTSLHLARLWANDEVDRLLTGSGRPHTSEAQALAMAYQIVTPVTGAVVLESDAQYTQAGLVPPDGDAEVPTIPEPETWALMIALALLLLVAALARRRRGAASAA